MQYQRSFEIERRLEQVLQLVSTGRYSTKSLAEHLEVSVPTVSRDVAALRERGHKICAEKRANGWNYKLVQNSSDHNSLKTDSDSKVKAG
ncbi:helix-turn-helix domain-containing protein [Gimesia maris]|uniref:helix-turn-helix domain-containing protein n=1 Tax=Gimesia maris TaxID=122 RepID=UPI0032EB539F